MTTTAPDTSEDTKELRTPTADPSVGVVSGASGESPPAEPPSWALGVGEPPRSRRPRPPRRPLAFEVRLLIQILLTLCVGALGLAAYLLVISPIQQNNDQDRLYAAFREDMAKAIAPTGGYIDPGKPVALLTINGLHLNQVVVEGTSSGDLEAGPGHMRNTPLPGQAGVSGILGKASTFGAPFRQIDRLHPGDGFTVTTGQGTFQYKVTGVRRTGDPLPPALTKGAGRLMLVTAYGPNMWSRSHTVYVDADLVDSTQPTPSGRPRLIPPEENVMASDAASGNLAIVLWLQALGLVFVGIVVARQRWGKRETMVVGVPIALAVVWNLYESVSQLLPNLV